MNMNTKNTFVILTTMFPKEGSVRYPFVYDFARAVVQSERFQRVVVLKAVKIADKIRHRENCFVSQTYRGIEVISFPIVMNVSGAFTIYNCIQLLGALDAAKLSTGDIDVCQIYGWGSLMAAGLFLKRKNLNMKLIRHYDDFDPLIFQRSRYYKIALASALWKRRVTRQANQLDIHVGVSQRTLDHLKEIPGVHLKKEYVLYNGVDLNKFYPVPGLREQNTFHIGCVANFIPLKDQMTLLKAVESLVKQGMDDLKVSFIGSGPKLNECEQYVNNSILRRHVQFLTEVEHGELNSFYNSLDLFVLPSYCEALGCVYLEASACGVPFMGCFGQGIEEFIPESDKDRWLIQPRGWENLSIKIADFRKNSWKQELNYPIDIQWHVGRYLDYLEETFEMK